MFSTFVWILALSKALSISIDPQSHQNLIEKYWHDLDEFPKKTCQVPIWSDRWRCVTLLWKFIIHTKIPLSKHFRTTFKPDLACKFLPVRAIYFFPTWGGWPCKSTTLKKWYLPSNKTRICSLWKKLIPTNLFGRFTVWLFYVV